MTTIGTDTWWRFKRQAETLSLTGESELDRLCGFLLATVAEWALAEQQICGARAGLDDDESSRMGVEALPSPRPIAFLGGE